LGKVRVQTPAPRANARTDDALLAGVRAGNQQAIAELYDRHHRHVERVLARLLGTRQDVGDALQDVFDRAFRGIGSVRDPAALKAWLTTITVFSARRILRRRVAMRWLRFLAPSELPEPVAPPERRPDDDALEALRCTYQVIDQLRVDDRIPFTLRMFEDMDLKEIARVCGVSLGTIKRRLRRAEAQFLGLARAHPLLAGWVAAGDRWGGGEHER
jgi:RNA polymerase sigma-70 factor (ECF subfamily)